MSIPAMRERIGWCIVMTVVIMNSFHEDGFLEMRQLFIRLLKPTGEAYGVNSVFCVAELCILRGSFRILPMRKKGSLGIRASV
jgi:hypothetical protein